MENTECLAKVPATGSGGLCTVDTGTTCATDTGCVKNATCKNGRCLCALGCFHTDEKLCLRWSDARWGPPKEKVEQKRAPEKTTTPPPKEVAPTPAATPVPVCGVEKKLRSAGIL
eukprot:GEMP01092814.1.p2 GENE.GEMP01092814.1~~GEMP01092814.1.p2  ORF type:complete len:115 (+),score=36.57 GEMP01092814.1:379-723(+)